MIYNIWKNKLRLVPIIGILCGIEARAGFHSQAWESARFYCITEQVFITDHALTVTNWDSATNTYFTTNRFISNIYTWSNPVPFTNTWTELVPSGSIYVTKTQQTVEWARSTNLVLWNAQIVAFDIQQALQERNDILGGILEQPRLYASLRDTVVYGKGWIAAACVYFVDASFAGTNGTFDTEFATNRFEWNGSVWTSRPYTAERFMQYGTNRYGTEPFPMLSKARLEKLCALPLEIRITNHSTTLYGWQAGDLSAYTVSSNAVVTNAARTWWDFTPWRNLLGLAKPVYSQETTFVWTLNVTTGSALNVDTLADAYTANCTFLGPPYDTPQFTCWSRPLITPCSSNQLPDDYDYNQGGHPSYETNWWRYMAVYSTNSGPPVFSVSVYRMGTNDINTDAILVDGYAFNSNTPLYTATFTNPAVFLYTNTCKFEPIAFDTNDTAYGARGITNCLAQMRWTWRPISWTNSTGYYVKQASNDTSFGVAYSQLFDSWYEVTHSWEFTNPPACFPDRSTPDSTFTPTNFIGGNYAPRSHFLWGRSWICETYSFTNTYPPTWSVESNTIATPGMGWRSWNLPVTGFAGLDGDWVSPIYSVLSDGYMNYGRTYITATASVTFVTSNRACIVEPYYAAYTYVTTPTTARLYFATNVVSSAGRFDAWGFEQYGSTNVVIQNSYTNPSVFAAATPIIFSGGVQRIEFSPGDWQAAPPVVSYSTRVSTDTFANPTNEPNMTYHKVELSETAGAWGWDLKTLGVLCKWDQGSNGLRYR